VARYVLPVIGAVAGFAIGGPTGAMWGWQLGSVAGSIVDPQVIAGPRIGDIAQQTSQEGVPRPIVFGLSQPMAGNIIATSEPDIVRSTQGGKGGPKVETESVYRTYAVRVCEGPITRFIRIWRNNILVYDVREPGMAADNAKFLETGRLFLGTYVQNSSPDLEAIFGVGTTPAHRGTAYMVQAHEDLTDFRGAIPQWIFQVETFGSTGEFVLVYTSDATWTKPDGLQSVQVTCIGGGGGGCGGDAFAGSVSPFGASAGGGGGGGLSEETLDADDLPDTVAVSVGDGGAGGPGASTNGELLIRGTNGADGDPSGFGAFVTALGGTGGGAIGNSTVKGEGGVGDDETGGDGGEGANNGDFDATPGQSTSRAGAGGGAGGSGSHLIPDNGKVGGSTDEVPGGGGGTGVAQQDPAIGGPGSAGGNSSTFQGGGGGGGGGAGDARGFAEPPFSGDAFSGAGGDGGLYGGGGGGGGRCRAHNHPSFDGTATSGKGGDGAQGVVVVRQTFPDSTLTLPEVVAAICTRANLDASMFDVSELSGIVRGITIVNTYPAYAALRSLAEVFRFDPSNYDAKLHFIHRGGSSVATITEDDMLDDEEEIEQTERGDSISVPRVMHLNYYDVAGGLATDKQTSERAGDRRSVGEISLQSTVIMNADEAARVISINHKVVIEDSKGQLKFCLPDNWLSLVVARPVIVQWQGRSERCRIIQTDLQDGYQQYTLSRDRQSSYTSTVEGIPAAPQTRPPSSVVGPTLIQPLDIHIQRDADDLLGYYVAISGILPAWQGATVQLSLDGGANYIDSGNWNTPAVMGELLTALGDHPQEFPDEFNIVSVRIDTPNSALQETDLAGLLNRQNVAIIESEIIQFAQVDETSEGIWEISTLLRGRKGTDTASHPAGSRFVLFERSAIPFIPADLTTLNRTLTFRAISFGTAASEGTVVSMLFTGRSQTERAPAYLQVRRDTDDLIITWQGVGRLGGGATVAMGAYFAGYEVTITDGGSNTDLVNTAEQDLTHDVAGFASPINVQVRQRNQITGLGPAIEVIIE
jgi:hypothetical protein